jgi:hypothetical protein
MRYKDVFAYFVPDSTTTAGSHQICGFAAVLQKHIDGPPLAGLANGNVVEGVCWLARSVDSAALFSTLLDVRSGDSISKYKTA